MAYALTWICFYRVDPTIGTEERKESPVQYAAEKAERGSDALITLLAEQAQNPYKIRVQLLKHMFGDYCDRDLFVNAFRKQIESLSEAEVGSIFCEQMCYF